MLRKIKQAVDLTECFFIKIVAILNLFFKIPNDKLKIGFIRGFLRGNLKEGSDKNTIIYNHSFCETSHILLDYCLNLINKNYKTEDTKILVVTHEFTLTGAPKAALMLSKTLKKIYESPPVVMSLKDGPIKAEFEKEGLPVLLFSYLPSQKKDLEKFFEQFDVVIINSIPWQILSIAKHIKPPVIWWSHEIFKKNKLIKKIKGFISDIDLFLAGSPLVLESLKKYVNLPKSSNLLYGLDKIELSSCVSKDKTVFTLAGTIEKRKGTDVFVDAISLLPEEIKQKAVFNIIGEVDKKEFYLKIKKKAKGINFLSSVPFEELLGFYSKSDVIVSASRQDPMPVVLTYAFMFSKLVLSSDSTGTALLIDNNKNGVLFESQNPKDLAAKIQEIIEAKKDYRQIAKNGYEIYKKHFSMESFEENVEYFVEMARIQNKERELA